MGRNGRGKDNERKGNLVASAILGAAGLALGWAALELGTGGILTRGREAVGRSLDLEPKDEGRRRRGGRGGGGRHGGEPEETVIEDDEAVYLIKRVEAKDRERDTRSHTQVEEDEILQALDEGEAHTREDKARGTVKRSFFD